MTHSLRIVALLTVLLGLIGSAQADHQCLEDATNDELLAELAHRLGNAPGPVESATALYSCSYGSLVIELFAASGTNNQPTRSRSRKSGKNGMDRFSLESRSTLGGTLMPCF